MQPIGWWSLTVSFVSHRKSKRDKKANFCEKFSARLCEGLILFLSSSKLKIEFTHLYKNKKFITFKVLLPIFSENQENSWQIKNDVLLLLLFLSLRFFEVVCVWRHLPFVTSYVFCDTCLEKSQSAFKNFLVLSLCVPTTEKKDHSSFLCETFWDLEQSCWE